MRREVLTDDLVSLAKDGDVMAWELSRMSPNLAMMDDWPDGHKVSLDNVTVSGDYCGASWCASNLRSLMRDYPSIPWIKRFGFGMSEWLELDAHAIIPLELAEALVSLVDGYPVYDEHDHSEYEHELLTEAIADYMGYDLECAVADLDKDADVSGVRDAFWEWRQTLTYDGWHVLSTSIDYSNDVCEEFARWYTT